MHYELVRSQKIFVKTYGNGETAVKALKDVSFSVPKESMWQSLANPVPAKSTLLNMIGALDTPTSGKVLIDGKDIFSMNDKKLTVFRRRNIGFIFQAFNLVPELTVEQNIIFHSVAGLPEAGQKVSGRTTGGAESERAPKSPAEPAFRWSAATCGNWAGTDYPASPDFS